MRRGYEDLRGRKYCADQFDLPLPFERPRERLALPARGSLVRLSVENGNAAGVWRVKSALEIAGGGMFLGLEEPVFESQNGAKTGRPRQEKQTVFDYSC